MTTMTLLPLIALKRAGGMAQECLPSEHELLNSNPSTTKERKNRKGKEKVEFI
jgi:hypothetical protein